MFFAERKREVEARLLYDGRDCGAAECSEIIHQDSRLKSTCLDDEGMLPICHVVDLRSSRSRSGPVPDALTSAA